MSKENTGQAEWDIAHLRTHLQAAVDLEFWTIPFYMSAMYSIKDPSSRAYRLLQSVVNQEMLHVELASNVANAYGTCLTFDAPAYEGKTIPHLSFNLDTPNPTEIYDPYSAEIGPLDEERINAMCLVEYPEWRTARQPNAQEDVSQYGSIGEFYKAVEVGATELWKEVKGDVNQVNIFKNFYNNFAQATITKDGKDGLAQAVNLVNAITDQGEGQTKGEADIPVKFQNTADGFEPAWTHFRKFASIRATLLKERKDAWPETYSAVKDPEPDTPGYKAQETLIASFTILRDTLEKLFRGENPSDFGSKMSKVGGDILSCWKNGAIPKFSDPKC